MSDNHPRIRALTGVELIAAERARQMTEEGWTADHDDEHDTHELTFAAWCYLTETDGFADCCGDGPPEAWPWEPEAWKPTTPIRNLVKAGALIAAEIDRLQRKGVPDA